jgi:phosphatidylglycerol lysyltransferase
VLTLLLWLLVPWTLILAGAPSAHWFPSALVQLSWVLFDGALLTGLVALRRMRSQGRDQRSDRAPWRLVRALAVAVSVDAVLTVTEAIRWNLPRIHTTTEALAVTIACVGPCLAAPVLWGAARRMRILADVHGRDVPPTAR